MKPYKGNNKIKLNASNFSKHKVSMWLNQSKRWNMIQFDTFLSFLGWKLSCVYFNSTFPNVKLFSWKCFWAYIICLE